MKRYHVQTGLALFTLFLATQAMAQGTEAPPVPDKVASVVTVAEKPLETLTLNNGARLVVLYDPKATTVVAEAFFLVGLADERKDGGINSLIARTWTGESENRIAAGLRHDVAQVGSIGTNYGDDWIELWGISRPDAFSTSLQTLLTNLVTNPRFSPELIEAGKTEQLQAITLERDNLLAVAMNGLRARAFSSSPYAQPSLGTEDSIGDLTAEEVTAYYRRCFRPERAVFVVAGPVKAEDAKRLVEASLGAGGWNNASLPPPQPPTPATPSRVVRRNVPDRIPAGLRDVALGRRAPATVLAAGYLTPGTTQMRRVDYATLLVLDAVLGGGKSARLFRALRDGATPAGYDVRTLLSTNRGQGLWTAYVIGDRPPQTVRNVLLNELSALGSGERPVTPEEVERARVYLLARHLEDHQRLRDRAFGVGWAEAMGLGADFDADFAARLALVTADDVNAMGRQVLGGNAAVVYTMPLAVE